VSVDRCNKFCFPTILMMILERHYDYPIIEDNKYNDEKSVRKCIPSILTTYRLYRNRQSGMNCSCIWICARRDIDLPWLILLVRCWCAKRASEHFLTISPIFSPSLSTRERARSHIHIHIQTRYDEDERMWASISFYLKYERRWKKNRFIFFFSSSSSCHRHVQNGQDKNNNSTWIFTSKKKKR
jgi:hypothetical protein